MGEPAMTEGKTLPVVHKVDTNKCTGCGVCVEQCPQQIMELYPFGSKKKARCKDLDLCVACLYCQKMCPEVAITVEMPGVKLW
ncbi:MAG: 4Fe-4S binding protein [Chloroflexota bacterium]